MAKDDDRRASAGARRETIIRAFTRELDDTNPRSAARRLDELITGSPRPMIVSGDIDGLVSAAMLRRAAPEWDAVALIIKSGEVLLHPAIADDLDLSTCFGVDVFSTYVPNVSNHVVLWGDKKPGHSTSAALAARAHDREVHRRAEETLLAAPSLWAGIQGAHPSQSSVPTSAEYRYPLGTAHILLALLEVIGRSPKLFDREYLPWLVANCDGGVKTIRDYAYNVPMWWSALAAAVGPASISEQIYQLAANQRPTEFGDAVNRLRTESHLVDTAPAAFLDDKWNLRNQSPEAIAPVVRWISSLSGWPDPFRGGAQGLPEWRRVKLGVHGKLSTTGLPTSETEAEGVERFKAHLRASLEAVHTNFAFYKESQRLNWVGAWPGASIPSMGGLAADLLPSGPPVDRQVVAEAAAADIVL